MLIRTRAHAYAAAAPLFSTSSILAPLALAALVGAALPGVASADPAAGPDETTEQVIVTGSPISGDPDRFATIVTQVNRDDIVQSGGSNLSDALRDVPGVANTSFAAGASRPVIRGMDAFRVATLENGLNSSDVSEVGPDHGVPIDPLSAQSIEVVRGAATLRYGSQAIGGAINAINNRVPRSLNGEPLSGEVTGAYDSNGGTGGGSVLLDGHAGQFAFHVDGFARRASDYDTPDGEQANSFFQGSGYSGGGSYFFGPDNASHVGLALVQYDARYGIPSDDTFIDMTQKKVLTGDTFHLGDGLFQTLNIDAGYAEYHHNEVAPDGEVESTFNNRETNARAELLLGQIGPFNASAVGVQYGDRNFNATEFLFPAETTTGAVFGFAEAPLGAHAHLQTGVRVEHVSVDGTPISDIPTSVDFTPVSGSAGVLFDLSNALKLGVTLSSAARAPGQVELFAHGPHDGPGTFEIGDPDLKIERSNSLEATLRYHADRFRFEGALWGARFDNYIFGFLTGRTCDDDISTCEANDTHELKELEYRQQDATFWGAEGNVTYDLISAPEGTLRAVGLADYVRAKLSNGGGDVPRIQPYRIGAGLNWSSAAFDAGFLLLYVGKQDHVPVGDSVTDSYVSLDANLAWRPLQANDGFEIALVGHNLTDDVQRNAVALNRDVVELPGRDVRLVLRQSF